MSDSTDNIITLSSENGYSNNDETVNSSDKASITDSIEHAKTNKLLLDNISRYYKYNNMELNISLINKYSNIINSYTIEVKIKKDLYYRPEYISLLEYGTTDLWYLILFVNNMTKPDELNKETIKIFNPAYLDIINNIIEKEKNNINNYNSPINISNNQLKDLNKPSKKILKKNYNKKIKPIVN